MNAATPNSITPDAASGVTLITGDSIIMNLAAAFRRTNCGSLSRDILAVIASTKATGLPGAMVQAEVLDFVAGWEDEEWGREDVAVLKTQLRWSVFSVLSKAAGLGTSDGLGAMDDIDDPFADIEKSACLVS